MEPQIDRAKSDSLDVEFRKILATIREQIPSINSNAYLMQCRLWLEKLSNPDLENQELRNLYLAQLCKQIGENKLLPPFNEAPPKGNLKNFIKSDLHCSSEEGSSYSVDEIGNNIHWLKTHEKPFLLNNETTIKNKNMCGGEPAGPLMEIESKETIITDETDSWSDLSDESFEQKVKNDVQSKDIKKITKDIQKNNIHMGSTTNLLSDPSFLSQDWKKTIAALQLRLSEMIHQNDELNRIIQKLEVDLEQSNAKIKSQSQHNVQILKHLHSQEIEQLKNVQTETILQLEETLQENYVKLMQDYEKKIDDVTSSYEFKISETKQQNEDAIKNKDNEIERLSEIIQNQCLRIMNDISSLKDQVSNCSCDKKVNVLKKCVSKIDRLFQKSEQEYVKQIQQLKQELELKESSLQVQLKIQKAEVVAQTRTGQKEEFEEILNTLEIKYIKMLEAHEEQIMETKKRDDQKIQYLTGLLLRHGIIFDE
ncbi:unnamed protein product [Ceutorhynchus assimilis]|uniref:DUF4485 domain-containing protein n=1 Tax=Ceutorhynchus assimilis TaxID=467358 RepID=A0A9N9N1V5_9CUCU|nr:unnamed protein product [Ceutorhynchus assimilis]